MQNKKASITVSFSWVFMIIIGTSFLLLSYNVIAKYKTNEDAKVEIEIKQALRNILNNIGRTTGIEENSLQPIKNLFRNTKVELLCLDDIPILSLNGKLDANNEFLKNNPTFMTYIEQGKVEESYIGVESFNAPFKVSNLLAIISKKKPHSIRQ